MLICSLGVRFERNKNPDNGGLVARSLNAKQKPKYLSAWVTDIE